MILKDEIIKVIEELISLDNEKIWEYYKMFILYDFYLSDSIEKMNILASKAHFAGNKKTIATFKQDILNRDIEFLKSEKISRSQKESDMIDKVIDYIESISVANKLSKN